MRFLLACLLLGFLKLSTAGDVFNRKQPRLFTLAEQLEPHATIGGYPHLAWRKQVAHLEHNDAQFQWYS